MITDGEDLPCMDLKCLVPAIPGTIVYKLASNSVLFQDDDFTKSLIHASTYSELSSLLSEPDLMGM